MVRLALAFALLAVPSLAAAQGLTPDEAVKRMKLPDGFSARCVASEPMVRQPVSISFDTCGRMWVLQYLQYPNYAGLKPVKQDQYLRTVWDKTPEPPPHGPKGADRLTILSDPDESGVFRKAKDFVGGLNIASGFCLGHGGVYVAQPPYLLFYPDKDEDDVPDGDPEVLLTGFGMDDTHSLANSLQWGPDGWLYGAAGSTSTCKIKNPHHPKDPVVEFQQGVWRFHPKTKKFELFSEGGGNTYGLDFDRHGQLIAGTNFGGVAMLHQMQGAYHVKGFAKHGPLHNPHAYGYFEHVPYTGFKGGHVTCGGIVYQADAYPEQYRNQYVAANLLSNAVNWHKLEPAQSSFRASHGGGLLEANDPWFRPVDCLQGPDGCVYVVDFYDRRAAHLDPVDNWDKTNGRIYRIEYKGGPKAEPFDLRKKTGAELAELLKHPNAWHRREARRLLAERGGAGALAKLRRWVLEEKGDLALEALWALYASGGWLERDYDNVGGHPNEHVRAWAVRLLADDGVIPEQTMTELEQRVRTERSPVVLAQLMCSARRLDPVPAYNLTFPALENPLLETDPQLPHLVWWVMEYANTADKTDAARFPYPGSRSAKVQDFFNERTARRLMSPNIQRGLERIPTLFQLTQDAGALVAPVLCGCATALQAHPLDAVPAGLRAPLAQLRQANPRDLLVLEVLARMNDDPARTTLREIVADRVAADADRAKAADLLRQVRDPKAKDLFLGELRAAKPDAVRVALLAGLEGYDDPKVGEAVLAGYPGYPAAVKKRAVQLLLARPAWALGLFRAVDAGTFPKADVTVEQARAAVGLGDKDVTALVEKQFGKLAPATAGEKQARIAWLNAQIPREKGADAARGQALFAKHCAACHVLHGEGGNVGPDLTTADRKNRGYLLAQIVDPSGYIRPEFVVQNVLTTDDRKLSGIAKEVGEAVELSNWVDGKVMTTVVPKKDIADARPSAVSLMPEKLLDTLSDAEIADLFAFLMADPKPQGTNVPRSDKPDAKKLKVVLVSGSFEYKSDASLAAFKKHLEASYPVECVLVAAKVEKDKALPGIEALATADVAVFFTRRLQLEGESLDAVKAYLKSGKPVVGVRTASHGFQNFLEMDKDVFGGDYKGHYGKDVVCEVAVAEKGKDHPVLKGVAPFKSNGSLYKNANVAADATVLLTGTIPTPKQSEPVAWVREKDGRRVFYTSLGHPDDFADPNFLRLLTNGLSWAAKTELKK